MKHYKFILLLTLLSFAVTGICSVAQAFDAQQPAPQVNHRSATATPVTTPPTNEADTDDELIRPTGWHTDTHSNQTAPNYDIVFPQNKVNQLTISITPASWAAMQANMVDQMGQPGQQKDGPPSGFGGPPGTARGEGNFVTHLWAQLNRQVAGGMTWLKGGDSLQHEGRLPPQLAGGGPGDFGGENPAWITATLTFEGKAWTNVGVRYKGNSSLRSSWNSGSLKLPLKLDFDEFEDDYPEIENQRFFGFKQLSLANGFGDATFMRDTITYYLLDKAGLPAAKTAYYNITLDYGEGPIDLGLYTAIEVIDDTVIDRYFGNDKGNIYEADGRGVSLAENTFDQIEISFLKENNKTEADWSDIEALYQVLHAEERTSDPAGWRANMEAVFDVDGFLEWLAISAALQHWDSYGGMSHNYYLYHNPDTDQLTWISWDHNLVLGGSPGGGGGGRGEPPGGGQQPPPGAMGPGGRSSSLDKGDVDDNWPLIRYLLDDPTYSHQYFNYLAQTGDMLGAAELTAKYHTLAELIRPHVDNPKTFDSAVQALAKRIKERAQAVTDFLATQTQ